jgi:hypothetical protein
MKLNKHLKILAYLVGSGLASLALVKLDLAPEEYQVVLTGAINYIAYILELELKEIRKKMND